MFTKYWFLKSIKKKKIKHIFQLTYKLFNLILISDQGWIDTHTENPDTRNNNGFLRYDHMY